jgi:hypothetical protein
MLLRVIILSIIVGQVILNQPNDSYLTKEEVIRILVIMLLLQVSSNVRNLQFQLGANSAKLLSTYFGNGRKINLKLFQKTYSTDSALTQLVEDDCFACKQLKCVLDTGPCNDIIGKTMKSQIINLLV